MPHRPSHIHTRPVGRRLLFFFALGFLPAALPGTALANPEMEILLRRITRQEERGGGFVELRILNPDDVTRSITLPDRIEARIDRGKGERTITLTRAAQTPATIVITAKGFAAADYLLPAGEAQSDAVLSIPAWSSQTVRLVTPPPAQLAEQSGADAAMAENQLATAATTDRTAGNLFLGNFSVYEPIYAVYGPGTNTEARIQISFKYKLFGSAHHNEEPEGLHFAYTQRMFWDLAADSSPFRNIEFQPELTYMNAPVRIYKGVNLAGQASIRHESNGRDGPESRSINSLYLSPIAEIHLSDGYRLRVAPRLALYFGDKSDNRDIARYRGNAGLLLELGRDYGLRLSTSSRYNPSSGKGAFSANLSYPLPLLLDGAPDVYLFTQSFVGYGENLLDYNQRTTRLRFGLALVR